MDFLATTKPGRSLGVALLGVTATIMAAFVVVFGLNRTTSMELGNLKTFVDIGGEANLPTWWNASLLFTVCLAALACAFLPWLSSGSGPPDPRVRAAWLVIAAAGAYLSLDETAGLHERLAAPVRSSGLDLPTYAWLVPGAALAALGCVVLVKAARQLPTWVARRLAVALACYFVGAIGMEGLNGLVSKRGLDLELVFAAGTTLEETLEMVACILAVTAIVDHLVDRLSGPTDIVDRVGGAHRVRRG